MTDGLEFSAEELTQASEQRLAEMDTSRGAGDEQPEEPQVIDEAIQSQDTEPEGPTLSEVDASVLEAFPETMREKIAALPAEVLQELQKGYLRNDDYTRKSQATAEQRKELERAEEDARNWRELVENDSAREAVMAALKSPPAKEEQVFDWTTASNEEIHAEIRRQALEISQGVVHERVDGPAMRVAAIKDAALTYRNELGDDVSDTVFGSAWREMIGRYGEHAVTPENARHLLSPFVDLEKLKAQIGQQESSMSERVGKAATLPSVRSSAPKAQPKWKAEGRSPTESESMQATLSRLSEMTGSRWSESDLDDLLAKG